MLAILQRDVEQHLARGKAAKASLDAGLAHRYADRAAAVRRGAGKDTGSVRFDDGDFTVVADMAKRVDWARVSGTEWKPICWQFGISRPTAHRRWEYGLSVIVWRLNGRRVPTKRSRRYVVEGARGK